MLRFRHVAYLQRNESTLSGILGTPGQNFLSSDEGGHDIVQLRDSVEAIVARLGCCFSSASHETHQQMPKW